MNGIKLVGVVLLVLGGLALGFGSFSFTKATHQAKLGPLELSVKEKQTVNVPVWAGGAAMALGLVLVLVGGKR